MEKMKVQRDKKIKTLSLYKLYSELKAQEFKVMMTAWILADDSPRSLTHRSLPIEHLSILILKSPHTKPNMNTL